MNTARQEIETWLTTSQAAQLEGISRQAAYRKASNGEWIARKQKITTGCGGGGKGYMVALSSLSATARRRFYFKNGQEPAPVELVKDKPEEKQEPAASSDTQVMNLAEIEALVGKVQFRKMLKKAEFDAKPVLEFLDATGNKTDAALEIADRYGISTATLYRRVKDYKQGGVAALMRQLPSLGKGKMRRSVDNDVEKFARAEWLQLNKPKVAHVHKKVKKFCEQNGYPVPSRATIYRVIEDLKENEPDLVCLAREGEEEYMKRFAEKAVRNDPEYVNQIWEGDHHLMDVFVAYQGKPVRPWLTAWLDVASRTITGVTLALQCNGRTIALALRHGMLRKKISGWDGAISKPMAGALYSLGWDIAELDDYAGTETPICGIPEVLYIDNGKDYVAQVKKGRKSKDWEYSREVRSACDILNIKAMFATAYSPWAKGHMERWFGTLTGQFSRYLPGYCGSDNKSRPYGLDEKKMAERGELLELEELYALLEIYIHIYHNTLHSSLGMSPYEKYERLPKARQGLPEERVLDICLMDVDKAKVHESGIQRFGTVGKRRWYTHQALESYVGRQVVIRYDPNRIGELLVFDPTTGKYVCTATNRELMQWGASQDDIKEFLKRRARRKKQIKARLAEYKETLEDVVANRQESGPDRITGKTSDQGDVRMITGMEEASKADKNTTASGKRAKKQAANNGRFDEYIRKLGNQSN
ncbi:Mu transposase C-terminal domain-containing protein [Desulfotruncus alcoholivorax]|uniref:Mu transposase C-terminal domain-containing protein n=1 Tax=Desulfotruncus alcoholivorax TaxID=265477 RepID=UPI0003F9FD06|nr:Mu transposase C-terminal domain-containing protein [Desulfotruncus alcoholivorax]